MIKMKKFALLLNVFLLSTLSWGFDQNHQALTDVLKKVMKKGLVNYQALKNDPKKLEIYLTALSQTSESDFQKWSENQQLAFWINAYNALTLKAIITHYPIKAKGFKSFIYPKNSIRQIRGVWDKLSFSVLGKKLTLYHIEHEIIRKEFNEPRIHMALVCAALSCPELRDEAYVGDRLIKQLDDQAQTFLSKPDKFKIDRELGVLYISTIFDWFGKDFVKTYGGNTIYNFLKEEEAAVLNFIYNYLPVDDKSAFTGIQFQIKHLKYDWTLNEWKK